jgi:hypothetical protein
LALIIDVPNGVVALKPFSATPLMAEVWSMKRRLLSVICEVVLKDNATVP